MDNHDDVRRSVYALAHRDLDPVELFRSTVEVLRRATPADGWCGLTLDPVTLLPTGGVHDEGVASDHFPRLLELEHSTPDAHRFIDLASSPSGVGVLSASARHASPRFAEVIAPSGFRDELRAALRVDGATWGGLVLFRQDGDFDAAHARLLRDVSVFVAAALRRALARADAERATAPDGPGVLVFEDGRLDAATPAARAWMAEIVDVRRIEEEIPPTIVALAEHARAAARAGSGHGSRTRLLTRTGRWLAVEAVGLDADGSRLVVTLEPADPLHLAPLLMEAYDLTTRERDVVELVLRGQSTREIAAALFVTPNTVQDHLKSVFAKLGVRSRREIVGALLYRHYLPAMEAGQAPSAAGFFDA